MEIGLEIKEKSPFERTFLIGLANGGYGYLPPPNQHKLGGYETWLGHLPLSAPVFRLAHQAPLGDAPGSEKIEMKKVLIIVGDASETLDTLYPFYRLQEAWHTNRWWPAPRKDLPDGHARGEAGLDHHQGMGGLYHRGQDRLQ